MHKALKEAKELLEDPRNFQHILNQEKIHLDSAPTNDKEFDRLGYKIVRNMCDPKLMITPVPKLRGTMEYDPKTIDDTKYHHDDNEQVEGSIARYYHPFQRKAFTIVKKTIEDALIEKLYKTYYYDRFYFAGQDLPFHSDRAACEISVTIHCSTNLNEKWPIYIKSREGNIVGVDLNPGDGMIYKGVERPHWRLPMPGVKRNKIRKILGMDELYYHQVFFHFVLANGMRSYYQGDPVASKHSWG